MKALKRTLAAFLLAMVVGTYASSQCLVCGSGVVWYCYQTLFGFVVSEFYFENDGSDPNHCIMGTAYCTICSPVY